MAMVILFGGGDAGGLYITAEGVRPIPPFDPFLLKELKGLANLVGAASRPQEGARELAQLVNKASNITVGRVEAIVGPLDEHHGLIYLDDDGGFTCGSTGKPPIPIPWPPKTTPTIDDLIMAGALDEQVLALVDATTKRGIGVVAMLEDPMSTARELGVGLSERAARDLQAVSPSRVRDLRDPVDVEVVTFFHRVLEDGRDLATWTSRPAAVAKRLGIELSDPAIDRVLEVAGSTGRLDPGTVENPVAIAVVVGIVIMLVDRPADLEALAVRDRSGRAKF